MDVSNANKRVLVTGADGFVGSHLVELLVQNGYRVRALVQYNSYNNWGWMEAVDCINDVEVIAGDIRDQDCCNSIMKNIDIVFHLAALIAIPYSYFAPKSYIDTNVTGTANICQSCLNNNVRRLVHTSTSEVYGTAKYVPIDEAHPLQPQSPYSASKIGADSIARSYNDSFKLPVTILRPFNIFGPRQSSRAFIPSVISQIANGEKEIQVGDLSPTRDFTYVTDTCRAFLNVSESDNAIGRTFNIGTNTEYSMEDILYKIKNLMNSDISINSDKSRLRPKESEVYRLKCDNSLIKNTIGFEPSYELDKGLEETIEWFKNPLNLRHYKTNIYNI